MSIIIIDGNPNEADAACADIDAEIAKLEGFIAEAGTEQGIEATLADLRLEREFLWDARSRSYLITDDTYEVVPLGNQPWGTDPR